MKQAQEQAEKLQREVSRMQAELQQFQENIVGNAISDKGNLFELGSMLYRFSRAFHERQEDIYTNLFDAQYVRQVRQEH